MKQETTPTCAGSNGRVASWYHAFSFLSQGRDDPNPAEKVRCCAIGTDGRIYCLDKANQG